MAQRTRPFPFHPLLFAVYPVTALLAFNIAQVRPEVAVRVFLLSLLGGGVLFGGLRWLLKDTARASVLATLSLVLFFSYGHVYQLIEGARLAGLRVGRHAFLAPLWLIMLLAGGWLVLRRAGRLGEVNRVLNTIAVVLVVFALGQIGWFGVRVQQLRSAQAAARQDATPAGVTATSQGPDVYYIILDGYTRQDALLEKYGYDNSGFIHQLEDLGFVVPDCTQSNYAYTVLSLASTFHMDYLENFSTLIQQGDTDRDWVAYQELIRDNAVRGNFKSLGYKLVAFETGYWWGEVTDADYYIVANNNPLERYGAGFEVNSFEMLFLRTTALRVLSEAQESLLHRISKDIRTPEQKHFDRINFSLDQLGQIPALPGQKFVFAHIIAPHPPFVFTETGEYRNLSWKEEGYAPEVAYLNTRVIAAVRQILQNSKRPPVIVIQGDHGWDAGNRMKILNAYYLPDGGAARITPQITPVNTFRLIFDTYFGGKYGLVKDQSYFSTEDAIYQFTLEPSTCVAP